MPAHKRYEIGNLRTEIQTFEVWDETFHCIPEAPGGLMDTLVGGIDIDANGNEVWHAANVNKFIEMVLLEERDVEQPVPAEGEDGVASVVMVTEKTDDMKRWRALMQDKRRPVPLPKLVEIVVDLSEYYNERPTEPSRR